MNLKISKNRNSSAAYTLIEALVAGVILMMGIAAAAQLTLTLLTQEELNRRTAVALNYQENAATLYQMGFDEEDILGILPENPVIESVTFAEGKHDLGEGLGEMDYSEIILEYNPVPADSSWTAGFWTGGESGEPVVSNIQVYRSTPPTEVN